MFRNNTEIISIRKATMAVIITEILHIMKSTDVGFNSAAYSMCHTLERHTDSYSMERDARSLMMQEAKELVEPCRATIVYRVRKEAGL